MAVEQALNAEPANSCCAELKKKCSKLQESRNALRQAVKLLEQGVNNAEAQNVNLKKAYQEQQAQTKIEIEEKLKVSNAMASLENEVSALKSELTALQQKYGAGAQEGNGDVKGLQACLSDKEKEINRLKELVEKEKIRADSEKKIAENEKKKAAEASKLLEAEKKISVEKGMQLAKIEAEKAKEYRLQQVQLEKEVKETKMKLASEVLKLKEAIERFEAEKQKLLVEKQNAESEMKNAQERVEVEKQRGDREKQRADVELVKLEEQKKLVEDNWKKAMEAEHLADQMSQKLEENKQTIEDLKQKIDELSSLRKPSEISGVSPNASVNAESIKLQLLENSLELEKLRAKHARKKFKHERMKFEYEASHRSILQHEIRRLKLDFIKMFRHFDMLDASFSPFTRSIRDLTKASPLKLDQDLAAPRDLEWYCAKIEISHTPNMQKSNVMTQLCNLDMSQMHGQVKNERMKSCSTSKGIGSESEPLIRGSNRTMLPNYAVNSSTTSFSDASLMGSQESGSLQITTSIELAEENLNARPSMLNPSDRSVIKHDRMGKRIRDTVDCIANLSSEDKKLNTQLENKLSDLHGLLYGKMDKSIQGEMVTNLKDNLQAKSDRAHKKRKKSYRADTFLDKKKETEVMEVGDYEDANGCRHTACPALYTTPTTQTCRERIFDASNNFDEVGDGDIMKLLDLENDTDEERYRRARDAPLSPSFPEIETFYMDNLKSFLEEVLHEDLLSQRDLFPSTRWDVIDVEINSNKKKIDAFTVPSNTQHKSAQARKINVELPDMHASENVRATFLMEAGTGHIQFPNFWFVLSDREEDNSSISRAFHATRNCMARCSLDTQTEWAVASILTAVKVEEMHLQKEKHYVLFTLLLFNFTMTTAMKFGKFWDGNLILCLNSYAEHICRGTFSSEVASSEQLVAASIILASLCAATDHVGFICEASHNILRLCKWDSLMVLTILHVFANLGGREYFDLGNFGLMVTVLKSLVMFLEEESISVTTASSLPSINQLHTELCANVKCPFSEGAESIDIVILLLLEKIQNCLFQQAEQFDSSNFRFLSDNYNAGQCSNEDVIPCTNSTNYDAPCCLRKHVTCCSTQPDVLINVTLCQLSDVLSLLELVANKMSWQWTNIKLVPQLLNMLDSCVVENFAAGIIVLLGQLGRLGVNVGGYEEQGVENLRCNLFSYLCRNSSVKEGSSLQIATACALFGLLPLDVETLLQTEFSLPAYSSKSVSDGAGNLRKWFSGLGKNQQDLLYGILRCTDAC
ncbi:maternal effect embryo arrest protein [Sesbania bispinosa]|nr:maternal effect embryo arrest protein [Sesbania bispinosa]